MNLFIVEATASAIRTIITVATGMAIVVIAIAAVAFPAAITHMDHT